MSANTRDVARKAAKAQAICARLDEIHAARELLIAMLDEGKLDLLILALGIGQVKLHETDGDAE